MELMMKLNPLITVNESVGSLRRSYQRSLDSLRRDDDGDDDDDEMISKYDNRRNVAESISMCPIRIESICSGVTANDPRVRDVIHHRFTFIWTSCVTFLRPSSSDPTRHSSSSEPEHMIPTHHTVKCRCRSVGYTADFSTKEINIAADSAEKHRYGSGRIVTQHRATGRGGSRREEGEEGLVSVEMRRSLDCDQTLHSDQRKVTDVKVKTDPSRRVERKNKDHETEEKREADERRSTSSTFQNTRRDETRTRR
ncbi:hypothetical protein F2P81_005190 [Scophthalmus maximus]|uniref:Uncharacterized protein n=1 Tax=Scophthalmus maximus TaxID=52904 RepID=A0A6A4TB58_SCOMX|nr:hypothetical protein F2P81_005190 [Scophthalmus maximus]